jgi:hypothetical protein
MISKMDAQIPIAASGDADDFAQTIGSNLGILSADRISGIKSAHASSPRFRFDKSQTKADATRHLVQSRQYTRNPMSSRRTPAPRSKGEDGVAAQQNGSPMQSPAKQENPDEAKLLAYVHDERHLSFVR